MSTPLDRRARKRLAMRQSISDAATHLFMERGFDAVTVDEIAAAADVGRMTVFNHFPRKEDLFFDRDEEGRDLLRAALRGRDPALAPIEALRQLAHRLVATRHPLARFGAESQSFIETVEGSATLKARARAIRDEFAEFVALELAACTGRSVADPGARLSAGLLLATWTVALLHAHGTYRWDQRSDEARAAFLALIDQGAAGLAAAMAGTPYA